MKVGTEITDSGFCGIYVILIVRNASFNMIKSWSNIHGKGVNKITFGSVKSKQRKEVQARFPESLYNTLFILEFEWDISWNF